MQTNCLIPTHVKAKKPPLNLFTELDKMRREVDEIKRITEDNAEEIRKLIDKLNGENKKDKKFLVLFLFALTPLN